MNTTATVYHDVAVYQDRPGCRVLDLRLHGIDCIPVLGASDFHSIRKGTNYHIHQGCIEICLCVRGNLAFETAEKTFPFLPGSIFISSDKEPHRMRHNPKGLMIYHILFAVPKNGEQVLGLSVKESEWLTRSLLHLPKRLFKSTPSVKQAFEALFDIYDNERLTVARSVKLKSMTLSLLISVIEAARLLPPKAPDRISTIMKHMRENPERDYQIGDLARTALLSESVFSETFKRAAGLPPHAYLISCRIAKAEKMLSSGNRTIKSVASFLHFYSLQHFSNAFRKIVGISPASFVQQHSLTTRNGSNDHGGNWTRTI